MSADTRTAVANHKNIVYRTDAQRSQILDTNCINTWLVAFLKDLADTSPRPILITALNTDHKAGSWHNPPGLAVDCWNADWSTAGDDKVVDVMKAAATVGAKKKPALIEVGLSGTAAYYKTFVTWPTTNVFIEDYGKENEHLHFAVGKPT